MLSKRANGHYLSLPTFGPKSYEDFNSLQNNAFGQFLVMFFSFLHLLYIFPCYYFRCMHIFYTLCGTFCNDNKFLHFSAPNEGNRIVWQSCKANASIRIEAFGHPFVAKSRTDYICVHGGVKDVRVNASQVCQDSGKPGKHGNNMDFFARKIFFSQFRAMILGDMRKYLLKIKKFRR